MKRIIHYDLHHKDTDDYQDLYDTLVKLNGKKITESVYWIDTNLSQKDIVKKLKDTIQKDDKVYYISVDSKTNELFCYKI